MDPRRGGGGPSHLRFDDVDADVNIGAHIHNTPALPALVEALPTIRVTSVATCGICLEDFAVGEEVLQLPCPHFFHRPCICEWFTVRNSCPTCRVVSTESTNTPQASTSTN